MKFTATKQDLLDALLIVSRGVSARAALPSLTGILFAADREKGLTARATDMELWLSVTLRAEVVEDGSTVLPGRLIADIVRSLPDGTVSLELRATERDVEINAGASSFHLRTLPVDDFPQAPTPDGAPVELPAEALRSTINRVARAASRDEARPVLTGVLVTTDEQGLSMVATDSYRLAVKRTPLAAPAGLEANVPARALRELSRLAESASDDPVKIWITRNQVVFELDGVSLSSRLIDGQFPNHRQLVPESYEHEVRLPRAELLDIVRRVSQVAQRNAALRLSFAEGELVVSAETPDLGDAREAIPAPFSGEPIEIGFNPEFVRDGLESIDSDEVVLKLISPLRPGLLEPADQDDFSYLVMPIRLNT